MASKRHPTGLEVPLPTNCVEQRYNRVFFEMHMLLGGRSGGLVGRSF